MAVKSVVLKKISDNSDSIGPIFRCAAVVARNMIVILVIIISTISLFIIRYDIGYAVVAIIVIGRMMVDIMVIVMVITMGDHFPSCISCLGR